MVGRISSGEEVTPRYNTCARAHPAGLEPSLKGMQCKGFTKENERPAGGPKYYGAAEPVASVDESPEARIVAPKLVLREQPARQALT